MHSAENVPIRIVIRDPSGNTEPPSAHQPTLGRQDPARCILGNGLDASRDTTPVEDSDHQNDASTPDSPPSSVASDDEKPELILRRCGVPYEDGSFWPEKLLRRLMEEKAFKVLIQNLEKEVPDLLGRPSTAAEDNNHRPSMTEEIRNKSHCKIIALLAIMSKETHIAKAIQEGISDDCLPLTLRQAPSGEPQLYRQNQQSACLSFLDNSARDDFARRQWHFMIPYFKLGKDGKAEHHELLRKTILPWCEEKKVGSVEHIMHGAYGFVKTVSIHKDSHDFGPVLKKMGLDDNRFALKCLNPSTGDARRFENERGQLNRFSGVSINQHLVTLLATYRLEEKYYFLFPYAKCDLLAYWEDEHPTNTWTRENVRWVSAQLAGLMSGLLTIHVPVHEHIGPEQDWRYARHGDIKPDNILWFPTPHNPGSPRGILVISDMGLSSINRLTSRSDIPGSKVAQVPGYCPPECRPGGKVSRKFDVWTMGCLFLDFMTWLLRGKEGYQKFLEKRRAPSENHILTNTFFERHDESVFQLKAGVTEWIAELYVDSKCTGFVHDVLKIIEETMLVHETKRAEASILKRKFEEIDKKGNNSGNPDYFFFDEK